MERVEYRWDLERILEDGSVQDLIDNYFVKLSEIVRLYEEDIFRSKEKLLYFHQASLESTISGNKLYNYLHNKYQEDLSNQEIFELLQDIKIRAVPYHRKLANFAERVIENKEVIEEYLKEEDFKHLARYYEKIFQSADHRLPSSINKFMLAYAPLSSAYENIFITLRDRNMPLKKVKDKKRRFVKLTNYEEFIQTQYAEDRVFRKNAYYSWHGAVEKIEDTLAQLLYYKMLEQNIDARNCNFPGGFYESRIFEDELPNSFVPYVYKKVARFCTSYKRFKKIRKRRLKALYDIKGVKPWDLRMPIVKNTGLEHIEISEAQDMVIQAVSVLGEGYVNWVKTAFKERWIDWECRNNKATGAYCISGCLGLDCKYILMNYQHKLEDVYTLIHELGHAVHAAEYCTHQTDYAEATIFVAEIPSSLNELLLSFSLIERFKDDPKKQLEVYDYLLNNFFASTINQVILSDWEYNMNKMVNSGMVVTAERAKIVYKAKQQKYQGNRITKELSSWKNLALASILTVPHFYSNEFYVYKYAVGKIVGLVIYLEMKKDIGYLEKYFAFLRAGNANSNLEALKTLGIDLERSNIWTVIKEEIDRWVAKYVELAKIVEPGIVNVKG